MYSLDPMQPLQNQPVLIDRAYERLVAAIADGSLPPGRRIRQEELAGMLGISRQPVSHALQNLKTVTFALPVEERAELAQFLIRSLEDDEGADVRAEWLTVCALILVAATLRFAYPNRLAVEHFDEGVYASNIWFADRPDGVYPAQHLYAPPLLPALIEWGFVFFGPSNSGAMWPNQVAGVVTVLLLWWLGRTWFGPVAGLTAAALCSISEVHLLLSRSALTDVLLGLRAGAMREKK